LDDNFAKTKFCFYLLTDTSLWCQCCYIWRHYGVC